MLGFGRKSDAALVREVLAGDREVFGLLVARHLAAVQGVAYAITRSPVEAEDIAQAAFLKAFESLGDLRKPAAFGAWVVQIARNAAKTHARARGRETLVEDFPEEAGAAVDPGVRELHAVLRREVMELGEAFREVIVLHYFSGLSTAEIARALGVSRAAAQKRLQRGRQELGERLTSLLGDALGAGRPGAARVGAIMAAVAGLTMPGRAGAVPAAAGGTLAGAGMLWYLGGLAVLLLALVGVVIFHPEQTLDLEEAAAQDNWPGVQTAATESPSVPPPSVSPSTDGPLTVESPEGGQEGVPGEISGRVTDSRGIVLESVQVLGRGPAGRVVGVVSTDSDGQYRLTGLGDGPHHVSVRHHGYWPRTVEEVRPGTGNVDFVLELMPAITGRVMDTQGRPIAGALVRGIALGGGDSRVRTSGDGEYRLVHLPRAREAFELLAPAEYGLHVSAPGFQREIRTGVEVGSARVDFHLERGSIVAGRVLRSDAPAPVPDASVTLADAETVTDADGFFEMDVPSVVHLRTETELMAIQARGYLQARLPVEEFLDPAPGKRPEAFLQPVPLIEGVVVDDWGDPVPSAGVYLIGQPEQFAEVEREGFISRVEVHEEQEGTVAMRRTMSTDEAGSFEIEAPLFWPESLHVRDPGAMMDEAWRGVAVSVPAWSTAPRVSLRVTLPGGSKLSGRLLVNGKPPADYFARAMARGLGTFDGLELFGFMDGKAVPDHATGAFTFPRITVPSWHEAFQEGAPPAEWDTSISLRFREAPGENGPRNTHQFSLGPVTLREGQTRYIEWDLPLVLLRGRMAGEQRTALRWARYSYTVRDNGPFRTNGTILPDPDGDFIVPLPPNATVEFELYLEETAGTVTVQTPAEGEITREFTLP